MHDNDDEHQCKTITWCDFAFYKNKFLLNLYYTLEGDGVIS